MKYIWNMHSIRYFLQWFSSIGSHLWWFETVWFINISFLFFLVKKCDLFEPKSWIEIHTDSNYIQFQKLSLEPFTNSDQFKFKPWNLLRNNCTFDEFDIINFALYTHQCSETLAEFGHDVKVFNVHLVSRLVFGFSKWISSN